MEIKTTTVFDKKSLKAIANVQLCGKKNPRKYMAVRLFFAFTLLVLTVLTAVLMAKDGADWKSMLLPIIVIAGYIVTIALMPASMYRNYRRLEGNVNHYTFTDSEIIAEGSGNGVSGESRISYENLTKVMETSDYIFIYVNAMSVLIIDKNAADEKDIEQIREKLLSEAGKKKYIVCKY